MATRDTYTEQTWENLPSENTPVSAERLEHIEQGIKDAMDNRALKEIYNDDAINLGRRSGTNIGYKSISLGTNSVASENYSISVGNFTESTATMAYSGGSNTKSGGQNAVANGYKTKAMGRNSVSNGESSESSGVNSYAGGLGTAALGENQYVIGKYNIKDTEEKYAIIIGRGTTDTNRKNAGTIDWSGNGWFAGDVKNGVGVSLNGLKTDLDNIQSSYMTYEETTTALNSQETGEINKIPNIYAIRDWCKALINPTEEV